MRYLVFSNGFAPFFTHVFNFIDDCGMIVFDLMEKQYTEDGINWDKIQIDKL
jgi:hypothetical protein